MLNKLNVDVIKTLKGLFPEVGATFKIKHEYKMNGDICSDNGKTPAMAVTRDTGGWKWFCHRCKESGFIGDTYNSPLDTTKKITTLGKEVDNSQSNIIPSFPPDFTPMINHNGCTNVNVPFEAYSWLWKYGLKDEDLFEFGFGWSQKYKRVILPIFTRGNFGTLLGWVGRNVLDKEKAKYYIQKPKKSDRIYFTLEGSADDDDKVILVEDCLSAIKLNKYLNVKTIALLTTSIDNNLINKLKGNKVFVWLDSDVLSQSVAMVSRLRQLGVSAYHIYTTNDPKCHNQTAMGSIWKESLKKLKEDKI
jgi:hypothetical protein